MLKAEALAIAASLKDCPFCCKPLTSNIRGAGDKAPNPKASCKTEGCYGSRLPVLCLDVPEDVEAWQRREQSAVPGQRYRLLVPETDRIEAGDEFLSEDTQTWTVDPNAIFSGMIFGGRALRPARRAVTK